MANKLRWGKFYWSDWSDDPALALCSLRAQGLWMRLMCIAAQGTPYGHVTINGRGPSIESLAKLIKPPIKPAALTRLIDELERNGVCSRDASGSLVSRRMEHDGHLAAVRSEAGKASAKARSSSGLFEQTRAFVGADSDSGVVGSDSDSGERVQGKGNGHRRPARNGFTDSIDHDMEASHAQGGDARPRGASVVPIPRRADRRQH